MAASDILCPITPLSLSEQLNRVCSAFRDGGYTAPIDDTTFLVERALGREDAERYWFEGINAEDERPFCEHDSPREITTPVFGAMKTVELSVCSILFRPQS
jgi:hypothetical protein